MKIIILLFIYLYISGLEANDFTTVMKNLENLEKYISLYKEEKAPNQSLTHLIVCYIRLGSYTGNEWTFAGGIIPEDLPQYIEDKDLAEGTNAQLCKTYRNIELPNKEVLDFVHFFAVMNGIEYGNSYSDNVAHLVGWGGDIFQLLQDIKTQKGSLDTLMDIAKKYFLISGGMDKADFISDLDAPILLKKKTDSISFADIIREYYNGEEYKKRINNFVRLTFPELNDRDKFREEIFNIYSSDYYIKVLECQDGIRSGLFGCYLPGDIKIEYTKNQKAAVYVFSDYLAENYITESD